MTDRFPDAVLEQVMEAYLDGYDKSDRRESCFAAQAGYAAMRAVLEAHLAQPCDSPDCQLSGPHTLTEVCYPAGHPETVRLVREARGDVVKP